MIGENVPPRTRAPDSRRVSTLAKAIADTAVEGGYSVDETLTSIAVFLIAVGHKTYSPPEVLAQIVKTRVTDAERSRREKEGA